MHNFVIDPRLISSNFPICDLGLSSLLLSGSSLFPWVILVPRRPNLREIVDLPEEDRAILMQEISLVSCVMQEIFRPDKLNVAALGNIIPQLHIHIVARYNSDSAWPDPVFGKVSREYDPEHRNELIEKIKKAILVAD